MSVITHLQLFSNMPYRYINQLTKLRQNVHGRVLGASVKNCFPRHKTTSRVQTYLTSLIYIKRYCMCHNRCYRQSWHSIEMSSIHTILCVRPGPSTKCRSAPCVQSTCATSCRRRWLDATPCRQARQPSATRRQRKIRSVRRCGQGLELATMSTTVFTLHNSYNVHYDNT